VGYKEERYFRKQPKSCWIKCSIQWHTLTVVD